jgi:predicted phosphodiesterase
MIAVISDVHSNLEALLAVLTEIEDVETVYCAGDLVGYGPNPNECCELLRRRGARCVMGNHDFVCANLDRMDGQDPSFPEEDRTLCREMFKQKNSAARAASQWTNRVLTPENKQFLRDLPMVLTEGKIMVVHGKPGTKQDMLNEYILPGYNTQRLAELAGGHLLLLGHSHIPMRTAHVLNPGSVGQPRDRNWMAALATFKDVWYRFTYIKDEDMSFRFVSQAVNMRRVAYDIQTTMRKIKEEPALPDALADRLTVGL